MPSPHSKDEGSTSTTHIEKATDLESSHSSIDPHLSARITRRFDFHIIPWLFGIWLLAFIDRSNIGNAKIDGLIADLDLTGNRFNIALTVFYVPYICVDVPSNWILKKFQAGHYLPTLIISWGIVSTCCGFVKSYAGLVAVRFFLGLCEGGLLGGIIIYLAMFYQRHELLARIGLFYCAAPLSGAFGGLLASGLAQIEYHGYNKWPWIFFVEGIITVLFGLCALFFMPHTPAQAHFLTPEERDCALVRMKADASGATTAAAVDDEKFHWHWVKMAFLNPNTLFCSSIWFFILVPLYSFSLFLPSIIKSLGYTSLKSQLFTVPPNILAFLLVLTLSISSDKVRARSPFILGGCIIGIIGYAILLAGKTPGVRYVGTFFVAAGVFPCSPMVMGWLANNTAPHTVRATAIGAQVAIANCAAFVATFSYLSKDAPAYRLGHYINLGSLLLCILTTLTAMAYVKWENGKRDRGERDGRLRGEDGGVNADGKAGEEWLGHRHPKFRYAI